MFPKYLIRVVCERVVGLFAAASAAAAALLLVRAASALLLSRAAAASFAALVARRSISLPLHFDFLAALTCSTAFFQLAMTMTILGFVAEFN